MRTSNPTLDPKTFDGFGYGQSFGSNTMTVQGTINKTGISLFCLSVAAICVWSLYSTTGNPAVLYPFMIGGAIGGLVVALITFFKKEWSAVTAPAYAILEGLFLGGLSAIMEAQFPGIVMQAVGLTFGTLFALLIAYKSGLIRATEKFKMGVVAATGAICLLYVVSFAMSFFGTSIPFIHSSGIFGIAFSGFVVVIAALNLVLDFDFIEKGAQVGAPKYMEWYAAFGLMVTLVWLYIEILRLLAKLRDR